MSGKRIRVQKNLGERLSQHQGTIRQASIRAQPDQSIERWSFNPTASVQVPCGAKKVLFDKLERVKHKTSK